MHHKKHNKTNTIMGTTIPTKNHSPQLMRNNLHLLQRIRRPPRQHQKTHTTHDTHTTRLSIQISIQTTNKDEHNRNITDELRSSRDCNWFDTAKGTHRRKKGSRRHCTKNRSRRNRTRSNPQRNSRTGLEHGRQRQKTNG